MLASLSDEKLQELKQEIMKEERLRAIARPGWQALPSEMKMLILKEVRNQLIFNKHFRDHRRWELENGHGRKDIRLTWNSDWKEARDFHINHPEQLNYETSLYLGGGSADGSTYREILKKLFGFQKFTDKFKNLIELHLIDFDELIWQKEDYMSERTLERGIQYNLGHWPRVKFFHLKNSDFILSSWMADSNNFDFPFSCLEECILNEMTFNESFSKFLKKTCKTLTSLKMSKINDDERKFEQYFVSIIIHEPFIPLEKLHIKKVWKYEQSIFPVEMMIKVLKKCPKLTELDLSGNNITEADMQMIQENLPSPATKFYFDAPKIRP